jgi:hypothetical protein
LRGDASFDIILLHMMMPGMSGRLCTISALAISFITDVIKTR